VLPDNQVKIASFGFTRASINDGVDVVDCAGAPRCIAPEQLTGGTVDHRTDLFTAGALLFEMLTAAEPFRAASAEGITKQIRTPGPENVCALHPAVPTGLRDVLDTALARDPRQRFATAGEFSHALRTALSSGHSGKALTTPQTADRSSNPHAEYDQETLRRLETELTADIGPEAPIAARRAAQQADDLAGISAQLSADVEDGRKRDEFLSHGLRLKTKFDRAAPALSRTPQNGPMSEESSPADLPDRAILEAIETELTHYVGPIAKFLLRQRLRNFETLPRLCCELASFIANESERRAFLNSGTVRSTQP
jgi:eukaryotic-like serine/threonine-protein kinase